MKETITPFLPQYFVPLMPVLDALGEGIMIVDDSGTVLAINKALRHFYHGGEAPFPGYPLSDFNAEDWVEVKRVLSSGKPLMGMTMTLPSATVLANRIPLVRENKTVGVVCSLQEVRVLEAIVPKLDTYRELDGFLDAVLDKFTHGLLVVNHKGIIARVNQPFMAASGLDRNALLGLPVADPSFNFPDMADMAEACFRTGQTQQTRHSGKKSLSYAITASPMPDDHGRTRNVIISINDKLAETPPQHKETSLPPRVRDLGDDGVLTLAVKEFGLVARSKDMQQVLERAAKVGKTESSVLLQGESGVGKSMLATLVHRLSPRHAGPFVSINCGAIPEQLMESELFGYERGAFTGANPKGKVGLIESANGGTVFFDEIGEITFPMQVKLLEAIDRKSFLRVGGTRQVAIDFRIVAATNRNLEEEVSLGRFRRDLFYRLNVIPICIPPLRERKDDIMALALAMLERHNALHATKKRFSPEVIDMLLQHDFPGNARELANAVEWMLVMGEGHILLPQDLPTALHPELRPSEPKANAFGSAEKGKSGITLSNIVDRPLKDVLFEAEALCLKESLMRHPTMQEAAKGLGIHPTTLWRKLSQHNLANQEAME